MKKLWKKIKKRIRNIDFEDIINNKDILSKVKKQIKECIARLQYVNYDTKLRFLFENINEKYELFKLESGQEDVKNNYPFNG